jgi:DNA polymerase-1
MYIIIDGSSMLSTNYYGTLPREMLFAKTDEEKEALYHKIMQSPDGKYTNGVFTSLKQILLMIKQQKPEGIIVVLDRSRNTFRRELYTEYKAQRGGTPAPLKEQFGTFAEVLEEMNIPVYSSDRYEADDLAGAIAKKLEVAGKECVLISGDKDYYQLVTTQTSLWRIIPSTAKEKYEKVYGINFDEYTTAHNLPVGIFETKYGDGIIAEGEVIDLNPEQFVDYLAVVGDKSDNIPGVDRVGPKSIVPLLKEYGSLHNIYSVIKFAEKAGKTKELAAEWKSKLGIKTSPINAFLKNEENAKLSQKLAQIETNIEEIPGDVDVYGLNVNHVGLENVIDRYAMDSLRVLMK